MSRRGSLRILELAAVLLVVLSASCRETGGAPPAADAGAPPAKRVYVGASTANLREAPSASAKPLARLKIGTELELVERNEGFARVRAGETPGWIASELLVAEAPSIEGLLERYRSTPEADVAARRTWIERAAALAPTNTDVLEELVRTLEHSGDARALAKSREGLRTARYPISWSGPLLVQNAFGPTCADAGAEQDWLALLRLSNGLFGRKDLVAPDAEALRPVTLEPTCEDGRLRLAGLEPPFALTRESLGDARLLQPGPEQQLTLERCAPPPIECPTDPGSECTCAARELPGVGQLESFTSLVEAHYEATLQSWPDRVWVRLARPSSKSGEWLLLQSGMSLLGKTDGLADETIAAVFATPGGEVRVALIGSDHCSDDYAVRMVRWLADGRVESGPTYRGDPASAVNELCTQ